MSLIPKKQYANILKNLPILCVDIIVRNSRGNYLLIKRANEPKKGRWWVIGGRVLKGESLEKAAARKVREETGQHINDIRPLGYFELIDGVNPMGLSFVYHTVSVVFSACIDTSRTVKLDSQSSSFKFAKELPCDFKITAFKEDRS